jgi:DNA ligase-1
MKPMLAHDWVEDKVRFPNWLQPKIDGVRGLNMHGKLTGRSLKPHRNLYTTELFSQPCLAGFDGELAADRETHPDLCRITSSKLSTIDGKPFTLWWLFDYIIPATQKPYRERYKALESRIADLQLTQRCEAVAYLRIVPVLECRNIWQLLEIKDMWLGAGYEGIIIRDPDGIHKQGRSTPKEGGLLRIKDFVDQEAEVIEYLEGNQNDNEAQINELGKTFRTSHQENMVPNSQVGTIVAKILKTENGLSAGQIVHVAPGNMDIQTRRHEWFYRNEAPGKVFTFKHFPKGMKDKPRFPQWKFWRDAIDTCE